MVFQDNKTLVRVAMMYYEEGMTQSAIAKKMGVSRSLISKYLIESKKRGLVEIHIHDKSKYVIELERAMEEKFGLKRAIVTDSYGLDDEMIENQVAQNSVEFLLDIIKDNKKIGVSWGKSLRKLVDYFPYKDFEGIEILPLIGGIGYDYLEYHSNQICYDLAQKLRAGFKSMYAPALVESRLLKNELETNKVISNVLSEAKNVDLAIVGIANPYKNSLMQKIGYIKQDEIEDFKKYGIIGDINSHFFDNKGKEAQCSINQRVIGLSLKNIKKIPTVFAIAYDDAKSNAIEISARRHLIDILSTTDTIAKKILE